MEGSQNTAVLVKPMAIPGLLGGSLVSVMPVSSPETDVRMVLDACAAGDHAKAASYFLGGAGAYGLAPAMFTEFLNVLSEDGTAAAFTVAESEYGGGFAALRIAAFPDEGRSRQLRSDIWCFQRTGCGWAIVGVI